MFGNSIASRVKKVIEQRVKDAQKKHDDQEAEAAKEQHAVDMVNSIIGKN